MYKLSRPINGVVKAVFLEDGEIHMAIPFDRDNRDYVEYLKWLEEGNQPLPADEPAA